MKTFYVFLLCLFSVSSVAKTYKIGTMIPKGTVYSDAVKKMVNEIYSETEKRVKLRMMWGGVAGDEGDVIRKIRIGQLHGGIFTAKAVSEIYQDFRVLEIPFSFKDRAHSQKSLQELYSVFVGGISNKGFKTLGIYETGEIYIVTKKKTSNIDDLKGQKLWLYQGDHLAEAFTKSLNLVAVPLALTDVLSSLTSGIIEVAYAPAIGIVGLQWHSKVSYLVEPPFAFHFQSFLMSSKAFSKIKKSDQEKINRITKKYESIISDLNMSAAKEAKDAILKQDVKITSWPKTDIKKLVNVRDQVIKNLSGAHLSREIIVKFQKSL